MTTRVSGTKAAEGVQDSGEFRDGFQSRVAETDGASLCSFDHEPSELGGSDVPGQLVSVAPPLLEADDDTSGPREDPFSAHKKDPEHTAADYGSRGTLRPHSRRLKAEDVAQGCLSIDLTGPFKAGLGGYKYALVANFAQVDATPLHFMRPFMRRLKEEVVAATIDIIAQVHSMAGCRPEVVRLRSDNAAEFVSATTRDEAAVPYEHASRIQGLSVSPSPLTEAISASRCKEGQCNPISRPRRRRKRSSCEAAGSGLPCFRRLPLAFPAPLAGLPSAGFPALFAGLPSEGFPAPFPAWLPDAEAGSLPDQGAPWSCSRCCCSPTTTRTWWLPVADQPAHRFQRSRLTDPAPLPCAEAGWRIGLFFYTLLRRAAEVVTEV